LQRRQQLAPGNPELSNLHSRVSTIRLNSVQPTSVEIENPRTSNKFVGGKRSFNND